ncbi:MAG: type II toxin-antitoxin system Phd/YefM family antitoxin [Candidatus Omnitrophica bacterium]|nr:type II toxin-antitoxin system Phd/YefM family antitoxin [Candidatus Omnitrophota bacterium]
MKNTLSLKQLRPELSKVIESIDKKFDRFIITKRGKPVVVMMSIDDYESLIETLDILEDKETMKRVRNGENEIKAGKTRSWRDVKRSYA